MGVQSGANLTGATVNSQSHELKTSSIADHDATTTPLPVGGGSEAGAQESPSISNIEREYNVVPPDKGKGKAVPDNTAEGGSGHDPPKDQKRVYHLKRRNESDDRLRSHSVHCCPTMRSDDEEILDILSKIDKLVRNSDETMAEAIRRAEEGHIEMQTSIANLHQ